MYRSANCIQMLTLLAARGTMQKEALAKELGVKTRNITEYRKELEAAGYDIKVVRGKYGGYSLDYGSILPRTNFTSKQRKALQEALAYLQLHTDFFLYEDYRKAMDKVLANSSIQEGSGLYLNDEHSIVTNEMIHMMDLMEQAKAARLAVDLDYKSMHAKEFSHVRIHPYELINYKGSYYCMAYSLKAKGYRNFKFSKERMRNVKIADVTFLRDHDFHIRDHVGTLGLIQHEVFELELLLQGEQAILLAERSVGWNPKCEWQSDGMLHYMTTMEGEMQTISFLLSLGSSVQIKKPLMLRKKIAKILQDMQQNYSV